MAARQGPAAVSGGRSDRRLRLLIGLTLLVVGAGLGLRDPWGVDEERFLGLALEMLQNGSPFILHRASEPYPDKPPLFMWTLAMTSAVIGEPRVAFRLPGLFAAVGCAVCLFDLGRRLWSRPAGLAAGLLFLATIQSMHVLRAGQTDSLLILWTTVGLYGLTRHLAEGPAWGWYGVAGVAMGLGVMTKGVGFLPLFLLIPYVYGRRRGFRHLAPIPWRDRRWWLAPLALLGTLATWLVPMLVTVALSGDPDAHAYARNLLLTQTARRMVAAWQHREPFWYFPIRVIPFYWLPLVVALPWLVPAWRRRLARRDGRILLLLGWVGLVVLFFSLSSGKRSLYVYPAVPALALAAAPVVVALARRLSRSPGRRHVTRTAVVAWLVALIAWGFAEPRLLADGHPRRAVMAAVAQRIGPDRELGLIHWREGQWLFARNPIVHFGYRAGPEQVGRALAWLGEAPDRWLLGSDRWLRPCFDMRQAIDAGEDRDDRRLFLVNLPMASGGCPPIPSGRLYRFRWQRPYG
jgi:4-amino-4-deoxy-L-arabinose transferase-like glycosyltransferase